MCARNVWLSLTMVCVLCGASVAWAGAGEAAEAYAAGKTLLARGDFEDALKSFKAAATADPENTEYFQESALLKRVINLRAQLEDEKNTDVRQKMSRALYGYYRDYDINGEALELARAMYDQSNDGASAARLADAQLTLDKNEETLELLDGLRQSEETLGTRILRGVALARLGKGDEAGEVAGGLEIPKDCEADVCYGAARLYALVGNTEQALRMLKCSFECTPPNALANAKARSRECPDLRGLVDGDAFAKVCRTKSKVKGCGGCSKSACGSKSKAGGCADKPKADEGKEKHKAGGCEHDKGDKG